MKGKKTKKNQQQQKDPLAADIIAQVSADRIESSFTKGCEEHLRKDFCEKQFCPVFPCDVVRHDIRILTSRMWVRYVRLN